MNSPIYNKVRQNVFPVLAALLWGTSFVCQSVCAGIMGPFSFNASRSIIAAAALFIVAKLFDIPRAAEKRSRTPAEKRSDRSSLWAGGIICGVLLTIATNFQQIGIAGTSVGKTAFITAMYIVLVPVLGIGLKKKTSLKVWISVFIAVFGLYFLCVKDGFSIAASDLFVLACALIFAIHILAIDRFTASVDGIWLSCVQFAVAAVINTVLAFLFEEPTWAQVTECGLNLLYMGIMSSGAGYTLQILAQKGSNPTVVTLLLSLESVFGTLAGVVLLNEQMSPREYIGCVFMFIAVILAQLPDRKKKTAY